METKFRLKKQNQETAARARKMNRVAQRLLNEKINILEVHYLRTYKQIYKEMQSVESDLKEINSEKQNLRDPLPDIVQPVSQKSVDSSTRTDTNANVKSAVSKNQQCKCRFGVNNTAGPCKMFPCYLPYSYNSIGYQAHSNNFSILSNYEELAHHSLSIRPSSAHVFIEEHQSEDRFSSRKKSQKLSARAREIGLQQIIGQMRAKNLKNKPKNWQTNYGTPISRRSLSKPVIAVSDIFVS